MWTLKILRPWHNKIQSVWISRCLSKKKIAWHAKRLEEERDSRSGGTNLMVGKCKKGEDLSKSKLLWDLPQSGTVRMSCQELYRAGERYLMKS